MRATMGNRSGWIGRKKSSPNYTVASGAGSSFPANQDTPWPTGQRHISSFPFWGKNYRMSAGSKFTHFGRPRSPTRDRKHSHQIDECDLHRDRRATDPARGPTHPHHPAIGHGLRDHVSERARAKPARGHRIRRRARGQRRGRNAPSRGCPRAS